MQTLIVPNIKTIDIEYINSLLKQKGYNTQCIEHDKIIDFNFEVQWKILDNELPDIEISDKEIMDEIKAYRND